MLSALVRYAIYQLISIRRFSVSRLYWIHYLFVYEEQKFWRYCLVSYFLICLAVVTISSYHLAVVRESSLRSNCIFYEKN